MDYREKGLNALRTILKQEKNIKIIEKHIYIISSQDVSDNDEIEQIYNFNIYQTIGDFLEKKTLNETIINIKSGNMGWKHSSFKIMQNILDEQNDFIENPFTVEEGVLECKARDKDGKPCGSKRVFSYLKQIRSADEPMTTFASCCKCGIKWQYSG